MPEQFPPRITAVEIAHLFGVPGRLEVSFLPLRSDQPASAIIFGENGSGKSSIAKAIEFAAQNRVNRKAVAKNSPRSRILNAAHSGNTGSATVHLSDGSTILRSVDWGPEDGLLQTRGAPAPEFFMRSPLVLTRADILSFVDSPPSGRGKIFLDYELLAPGSNKQSDANATVDYLEEQKLECKRRVREAAVPIAEHLGRPAPYEITQINELIADLYHGVPPNQRHRVQIHRSLQPKVTMIEELQKQIRTIDRERKQAERVASSGAPQRIADLKATLGNVDRWLTEAFLKITGADYVEEIRVELGRSNISALDLMVRTSGGQTFEERIFSEGYQDLVAMLFFLATAQVAAAQGQSRVLVLDDVLQSVDAHIRVAFMQHVLKEFRNWQLIVTVHDRLWREQLHKLFLDAGVRHVSIELRDWSFASGAHVAQSSRDPGAPLRAIIPTREPSAISALSGRLLEQICDVLSWTIPVRVQRRRNDLYTLEDLWPGVSAALKKSSASEAIEQVEGLRHLRNLVGAHHNEWAETVTLSETERFAAGVLRLLADIWCEGCTTWVQHVGKGILRCVCGAVEITGVRSKA